jgi:hypothetical protein
LASAGITSKAVTAVASAILYIREKTDDPIAVNGARARRLPSAHHER